MAFSTKNDEADRLARQLAALTGESLMEAVVQVSKDPKAGTDLARLATELRKLPVLNTRTDEGLLGYDENGLPR